MTCASQPEETFTRARILIVDDDATFRRYAARVLTAVGYRCVLTETTQQARAALDGGGFDLLLTDIHLTDGDGLALLRYVSKHCQPLPVVLVTGFPTVSTAVDALRLDAMDYLTKPTADLEVYVTGALRRFERRRNELAEVHARLDWSRKLRELADDLERGPGGTTGLHTDKGIVSMIDDTGPSAPQQAEANTWSLLSRREAEVARCLVDGLGPPQISESLGISISTVRNHLQSAFRKTGARSQVELVAKLARTRG